MKLLSYIPRPLRGLVVFCCWGLLFGVIAIGALFAMYRNTYPYGRDHCCAKQLSTALCTYAAAHDGHFPTGGVTPEASLSLLYPDYIDVDTLRGKTYPAEPARQLLEAGKPLTPDTCGWHYVDGLTVKNCPRSRIAIAWDKVGSGHNAEYLPDGGHSVVFMDAHETVIREADWARFMADQEKAWAAIRRGETPESPWNPEWGY